MTCVAESTLSVFIDESGDFGAYNHHSPNYFVTMVLHDQKVDISSEIESMEVRMKQAGYPHHAVHVGPLIRRESFYKNDLLTSRKHLFQIIYYFSRKLDFSYICAQVKKKESDKEIDLISKLVRTISTQLRNHGNFFDRFDRIIVYYDNGQVELTKIITSVFTSLFSNVEFRQVKPVDYRLFQVADLICTMELLADKAAGNVFSRSEHDFFGSPRSFKKDFWKGIQVKRMI